jgi:hypothetical protein
MQAEVEIMQVKTVCLKYQQLVLFYASNLLSLPLLCMKLGLFTLGFLEKFNGFCCSL